jgi:hypothetical protein
MNSEEIKAEAALEMDSLDSETPDIVAVSHIIASATRDCITLFDKMSEDNMWAQDQLTRFNIWVNNIGVFARGHASLDYRLRDAPDILDLMMQQVGVLSANLEARMLTLLKLRLCYLQALPSSLIFCSPFCGMNYSPHIFSS